jgi:hypothetical protein
MDELLYDRVKQLKEIDERVERILKTPNGLWDWESTKAALNNLRLDLQTMIQQAEADHAAF